MRKPGQIVSLSDMLQLPPKTISAVGYISACLGEWKVLVQLRRNPHSVQIGPANIDRQVRAMFLHYCEVLEESAKLMRLNASQLAAKRAFDEGLPLLSLPIGHDGHRLSRVVNLAEQLLQVFGDELTAGKLLTLDGRHADFYDMPASFGEAVQDAFPSATFDIAEAAKCRAVARWTASVMHLMRATETGLTALARHYGLVASDNWNQTLNQIEQKTREVTRRIDGSEAEQWASEAATHLRFVKNAWRNQAMHPKQTYDEERAVSIFDSTKAFMQHLATRVAEDGL